MTESPLTSVEPAAPRSRWTPLLAALLDLVAPPAGHLHAGALKRGVVLWACQLVLAVACIVAFARSPNMRTLVGAVGVSIAGQLVVAVDAARVARRPPSSRASRPRAWYDYAGVALASLLIWGAIKGALQSGVVRAFRMPSESMGPTLIVGDYFFADMGAYRHHAPARGDIVVYPFAADPRQMFAKRLVGLPGEMIEILDREVRVDGRPLAEPQVVHTDARIELADESPRDNMPARTMGPDDVFLMGDNRENSNDSRFQGAVPLHELKGKATFIYLSLGPEGVRWDRIGRRLDR